MISFRFYRTAFSIAVAASLYGQAHGQTSGQADSAKPLTNEERLEALDQKIRVLERLRELDKEEQVTKAKETPIITAGKDGFSLKSADSNFQLKLRGYVQADGRFFFNDDEKRLANTFLLRRVRPIFEGTVFKIYDFRIMPDFGGGTTVLQDAYVDARFLPELKLRVGKFKPPIGLERLQSATDIRYVERGYPTNLVPNRDVGAQIHGDIDTDLLSYAIGVFIGVPDGGSGDIETHDEKDFAARIFAQPLKYAGVEALEGLGLGVAGSVGNQEGALPTFRSTGQATIFSYLANTTADGYRYRVSPQAWYYWGPFGVLAEYVYSSQRIERAAAHGNADNDAWQAALSYVLTGENASFKSIDPKKPLDFAAGTWGALELVARVGELNLDHNLFPTFASTTASVDRAQGWGGGVNWYLNKNLKVALDYELTRFWGGAANNRDRVDEQVLLARLQVAF